MFLAFLLAVGAAEAAFAQSERAVSVSQGPRERPPQSRGNTIPGRFVITLEPRVNPRDFAREKGIDPDYVYTRVLVGFAGRMSDAARAGLLRDNRVVRVEPDRPAFAAQTTAWGLDRIDQRALPLDNSYGVAGSGRGVTVYVVDTGIRFDHQEFAGRAVRGIDVIGDGRNGSDCDGHGTHVAGTIGGATYGVAREATLVSARVLGCDGSGTMSGIIYALDWIAAYGRRPGVVNMSLGGDAHASTDDAVRRLAAAGFTVAVAAGNDGQDACSFSPARAAEALTVAATDEADTRASWSNYGSCVDLFAPGVSITAAWHTSATALARLSGTSMATPHVAGAAALLLEANSGLSPAQVAGAIAQAATPNVVRNSASANDDLLYTAPSVTTPTGTVGGVTIEGTSGRDVITPTRTVSGQPLATNAGDTIHGRGGDDYINGGGGADDMRGGAGDDHYIVHDPDDGVTEASGEGSDRISAFVNFGLPPNVEDLTLIGTAPIHGGGNGLPNRIYGNNAGNRLNGGGHDDRLYGGGGDDTIDGGTGSDQIFGTYGNDTLAGGEGDDRFYFTSTLSESANVDTITDFAPADDRLYLHRSAFAAIPAGTLAAAGFRIGAAATDPGHRIVYHYSFGTLYYDPDGSGPAAQVLFARVPPRVALRNTHFVAY